MHTPDAPGTENQGHRETMARAKSRLNYAIRLSKGMGEIKEGAKLDSSGRE